LPSGETAVSLRRTPPVSMATTRTPAPEIPIRVVVERFVPGVLLRLRRGASELVEPTSSSTSEVVFDFTVRVGPARASGALNLLGPFTQIRGSSAGRRRREAM
jgi:hypothetical protein